VNYKADIYPFLDIQNLQNASRTVTGSIHFPSYNETAKRCVNEKKLLSCTYPVHTLVFCLNFNPSVFTSRYSFDENYEERRRERIRCKLKINYSCVSDLICKVELTFLFVLGNKGNKSQRKRREEEKISSCVKPLHDRDRLGTL